MITLITVLLIFAFMAATFIAALTGAMAFLTCFESFYSWFIHG